jgi:hypothetical protein
MSNVKKRPLDLEVLSKIELDFQDTISSLMDFDVDKDVFHKAIQTITLALNEISTVKRKKYEKIRNSNVFECMDILNQIVSFIFPKKLTLMDLFWTSDFIVLCKTSLWFKICLCRHFTSFVFQKKMIDLTHVFANLWLEFPNIKTIRIENPLTMKSLQEDLVACRFPNANRIIFETINTRSHGGLVTSLENNSELLFQTLSKIEKLSPLSRSMKWKLHRTIVKI